MIVRRPIPSSFANQKTAAKLSLRRGLVEVPSGGTYVSIRIGLHRDHADRRAVGAGTRAAIGAGADPVLLHRGEALQNRAARAGCDDRPLVMKALLYPAFCFLFEARPIPRAGAKKPPWFHHTTRLSYPAEALGFVHCADRAVGGCSTSGASRSAICKDKRRARPSEEMGATGRNAGLRSTRRLAVPGCSAKRILRTRFRNLPGARRLNRYL
jgi:hypothetical protein